MEFKTFLNVMSMVMDTNSSLYGSLLSEDGYSLDINDDAYKKLWFYPAFEGLDASQRLLVKQILDVNLKRLGFKHNMNLGSNLLDEFVKGVKRTLISGKNSNFNNDIRADFLKRGVLNTELRNGLYVIIGEAHAGKQLINNYILEEAYKSKEKTLHISCGERADVLLREKDGSFVIDKAMMNEIREITITDDLIDLLITLFNSKDRVIIINSINTIINDLKGNGGAVKGGIQRQNIENLFQLLNLIGECLGLVIIITYRTNASELESSIISIINGVSWGYIIVTNDYISLTNRFDDVKGRSIRKRLLIEEMSHIRKV